MYLALFLTPWVLMYALSTMAMNHREFFRGLYGGPIVLYQKEEERAYPATLPEGASPEAVAEQVLTYLGLEGTHGARRNPGSSNITIVRQDPIVPRRITYFPGESKLLVEKEVFRMPAFLERMHRRRGYDHDIALEDSWAFSVDLVIVAMIFWVLSGLWMWWELSATRRLGAIFGAAGLGLFGFFLFTI
jgi:hypothetical protein